MKVIGKKLCLYHFLKRISMILLVEQIEIGLEIDWAALSNNKALTIYILNYHSSESFEWVWADVNANPGITMQNIVNHLEYPGTGLVLVVILI